MDQSVPIVSEFVKSGVVVHQEDQQHNRRPFQITGEGRLLKSPIVILVNGGTASAAEIVAGALQELKHAKLVGEITFGKGTIQDAQELSGGAGLHFTSGHWLLPSGKYLNGQGLKPDIEVKSSEATGSSSSNISDDQLNKAVEELIK